MKSEIAVEGRITPTRLRSLEALVENIPGLVYELRISADGAWRYSYLSPVVETLFEVSAEEGCADHTTLIRSILPEDRPAFDASVERAFRDLTPWDHEFRIRTPIAGTRWMRAKATPTPEADGGVLWSGFCTDVTQHKENAEQLQRSEARYSAIVDGQLDLVCRSLPDRTLTFVNQAYCDYFGRGRDALLKTNFLELIPEGERSSVEASLAKCSPKHPFNTHLHSVRRADGEVRWGATKTDALP